jgi:hypothetical protein
MENEILFITVLIWRLIFKKKLLYPKLSIRPKCPNTFCFGTIWLDKIRQFSFIILSKIHPTSTVVAIDETVSFHHTYSAAAPRSAGANHDDVLLLLQFRQRIGKFIQRNVF